MNGVWLNIAVDETPKGYPLVANFQSSDGNFLQYRGFFYLHSRLLSNLQLEIEHLELELRKLDQWDISCGDSKREKCLRCKERDDRQSHISRMPPDFRTEFDRTRPQLMTELRAKLMEYGPCSKRMIAVCTDCFLDEVMLKTKEINALQRPSNQDYMSVRNWFASVKPLEYEEAEYIKRKEDIVTLRSGRQTAGFDSLVECCLSGADNFLYGCFRSRIIRVSNYILAVWGQLTRITEVIPDFRVEGKSRRAGSQLFLTTTG